MADVVTVWNPFIITNDGLNLRQEAIANGKTVTFNYAKIGQGVPSDPANIPLMTDLVTHAQQVPVIRSESNGVTHFIGVRIDNITFADPVLMREIGVFASIDDEQVILYGYTYATQGYDSIPAGSVAHYVWKIDIDTVLSRAQSISFTYDGSNVYATYEDIDKLIQAFEEFSQNRQEIIMSGTEPPDWLDGVWWYEELDSITPSPVPLEISTVPFDNSKPFHIEADGATETILRTTDDESSATSDDLIII